MVDNSNLPHFFIENSALYFEKDEDDFREITMLRKWTPGHEPEYFDVWVIEDKVVVGKSTDVPIFSSKISPDGYLEHKLPSNYSYKWLGPDERMTMNEALGPSVEHTLMKIARREAKKYISDPFFPLEREKYRPITADVLKRLLAAKEAKRIKDLWLPFPQRMCCFSFGPNRDMPLPIGALFLLWDAGSPFAQDCPDCGGQAYMVSFGGLLANGGGYLVCTDCGNEYFQWLGGFPKISEILKESPLADSEFRFTGMKFGGVYPSDGAELCAFLGMEPPPDDEIAGVVYFKIDPPAKNGKNHKED